MRHITPEAAAVLSGPHVPLVLLVEMGFDPPLRLATCAVDIDWNSLTWARAGSLGTVEAIKDTTNGETTGLKFGMSAVPSENLALALEVSARNRPCKVWCALLDPDTYQVLDAPLVFAGQLDQMPVTLDGTTCSIAVTAEHQGKVFARVKTLRYNTSDQQRLESGDTSMRFLVSQANHQDVWPAASFNRQ